MDPSVIKIIILIVLLIFSGIFSASETAFSSVTPYKLKQKIKKGNKRALLVYNMTKEFSSVITTILIFNNIVNVASSALSTYLFTLAFGSSGIIYATVVMTILILMFGEVTPKIIARNKPEEIAMFFAPLIYILMKLVYPIIVLVNMAENKFVDPRKNVTATQSEFLEMVQTIESEGVLNQDERELIENAIKFDDVQVKDIMKSKYDTISIFSNAKVSTLLKIVDEHNYSRIPVVDKKTDKVLGVIRQSDILDAIIRNEKYTVKSLMKPAVYVSSIRRLPLALDKLQKEKSHIAIVVDNLKNKNYLGIITLEDMIEQLVGEIYDEHDDLPENVIEIGNHSYEVNPEVSLKYFFKEYIREDIPTEIKELKVAKFKDLISVLSSTGEIELKKGAEITFDNIIIKISKLNNSVVEELDIEVLSKEEEF